MKVKKRITIVADVLVDEDFDCDELQLCHDINFNCDAMDMIEDKFEARGEDWEVLDYVDYAEVELDESEE